MNFIIILNFRFSLCYYTNHFSGKVNLQHQFFRLMLTTSKTIPSKIIHSQKDYGTQTDRKQRWGGLLENPAISKFQRGCFDGRRVPLLRKIIAPLQIHNILEVGCGLGEYSKMRQWRYAGLDNCLDHLIYASQQHKDSRFAVGDANALPFKDKSFEAVLFACASHHFTDDGMYKVLQEMIRVSRRYIIVDDAIHWPAQGSFSKFMYAMDRGAMFRSLDEMKRLIKRNHSGTIVTEETYMTFPGIYRHVAFVLDLGLKK